jgi:hypothetical protein
MVVFLMAIVNITALAIWLQVRLAPPCFLDFIDGGSAPALYR